MCVMELLRPRLSGCHLKTQCKVQLTNDNYITINREHKTKLPNLDQLSHFNILCLFPELWTNNNFILIFYG